MILSALHSVRDGDFAVRLPGSWTGLPGKIADAFNDIVSANQQMAHELKRIGQAVGKEGRTRERARVHESRGAWGEMETSINTLVEEAVVRQILPKLKAAKAQGIVEYPLNKIVL